MNKLNDDMQLALNNMGLSKTDKHFIEEILYQERINKSKEWNSDAIRVFRDLLNKIDVDV